MSIQSNRLRSTKIKQQSERFMEYARRIVEWQERNSFRLSQVQGFQYGDCLVIRDCWLLPQDQAIWQKQETDNDPTRIENEMMTEISVYRMNLALDAINQELEI